MSRSRAPSRAFGWVCATLAGCLLIAAIPAQAALPRAALDRVKVTPPPHAALPAHLAFRDAADAPAALTDPAGSAPRVLVFADYACTTLCGPALSIVGARLKNTGLSPGTDYVLEVVGLDPHSTPAQAAAFGRARLPPDLRASLLTGDASAIAAAARSLGYGYVYDPQTRAFAHPVAAFVLTADGRLSHALSEVALTAPDLRAAIREAQAGAAPNLVQAVTLACHGALEAIGRYDGSVILGLRAGALLLLAAGAVALFALTRRRRPQG